MEKKDRIGERYLTNEGYWVTIIEYFGWDNSTIQFEDGTIVKNKQFGDIERGEVSNPYHRSVYGVGYTGVGKYDSVFNNEFPHVYDAWSGALGRSYSEKTQKIRPTYVECTVAEEWHCFQNFAKWHEENWKNHMDSSWDLDKDVLFKGNKYYSPETCAFIPKEINSLFSISNKRRGKYPIGVTKKGKRFQARVGKGGQNRVHIGTFDTPEEAFAAYKVEKELWIKEVADKWRGKITEPTYEAMYRYEVEITD